MYLKDKKNLLSVTELVQNLQPGVLQCDISQYTSESHILVTSAKFEFLLTQIDP
jgi:hypothetical protein